jgi:predicted ATPase/class 3 adenylate cyclase
VRTCANCSTPLRPDAKFCDECGTQVGQPGWAPQPARSAQGSAQHVADPASAERRLVSVLFADLVGFTSLSEKRDAEEVRGLLTRYFDTCQGVIGRYGGTIEKFIGDAVMAVWGAPVAHEDDAERAVRAALDLVEAVTALGVEIGAAELSARAGILTGDAAVTIGAQAQGMVAGDLVNTAARIQAQAQPGRVLVGEATRQATEASLVYEDAGEHTLKGKAEPLHLWQALRVVAGRGGAQKSQGLEAPFVGRNRELRLIKDLFHASAEEHKAHVVSVVGIAGIGKSRLVWEFEKYIDGLVETMYWHRGRCLAYGEGVTYWALAEMVRMRARIAEAEEPASARAKLQECLAEFLPDDEERRWAEPRIAQLLALEESSVQAREELFSAWRLFFERLAAKQPTILVFEDMQWADTSLLEFVEYLIEWSRDHALYVVTLARPDLVDRHPTWGAGKRNFTSVFLEPLAPGAMEQLLDGLVPGLPDEIREQILQRAEGVPLYAVETVRMLLDRGLLEQAGSVYRLTGPVEDLAVPQSLHALIAARLDGLRVEARRVLQDAAVLGKTFSASSLAAITGMSVDQLEPLLNELVRKEVFSLQADPWSPERGQYGFLQDLVKRVAYETLSKHDRKEKHLAVAAWLEHAWQGEEADVVEVVASHYLEAYNLAPHDPDAAEIRDLAAGVLAQAAERAAALAATTEAQHYFEKAAQLVGVSARQAELLERAGQMAARLGHTESANEHFERAIALYEGHERAHAAARVSARIAEVEWLSKGQIDIGVETRMERAFDVLAADPPDADLAMLALQLGRFHFFKGDTKQATLRIEVALDVAESLWLPEILSHALNTKALLALNGKHVEEGLALLGHALKLALENDVPSAALRAYNNMADTLNQRDRYVEAGALLRSQLALARKVGDRVWERSAISELAYVLVQLGDWDEAGELATATDDAELRHAVSVHLSFLLAWTDIYAHRGQLSQLEHLVSTFQGLATSADLQNSTGVLTTRAAWLRAVGRYDEALADAERGMLTASELFGAGGQAVRRGFEEAVESAFALGDLAKAEELIARVERLPRGEQPPSMRARAGAYRARLSAARGDESQVDAAYSTAEETFRQLGMQFKLAATQMEHAEWLHSAGRAADADLLIAESRITFVRLGATPWLERSDRLAAEAVIAS